VSRDRPGKCPSFSAALCVRGSIRSRSLLYRDLLWFGEMTAWTHSRLQTMSWILYSTYSRARPDNHLLRDSMLFQVRLLCSPVPTHTNVPATQVHRKAAGFASSVLSKRECRRPRCSPGVVQLLASARRSNLILRSAEPPCVGRRRGALAARRGKTARFVQCVLLRVGALFRPIHQPQSHRFD
jgi:hypothetical protein